MTSNCNIVCLLGQEYCYNMHHAFVINIFGECDDSNVASFVNQLINTPSTLVVMMSNAPTSALQSTWSIDAGPSIPSYSAVLISNVTSFQLDAPSVSSSHPSVLDQLLITGPQSDPIHVGTISFKDSVDNSLPSIPSVNHMSGFTCLAPVTSPGPLNISLDTPPSVLHAVNNVQPTALVDTGNQVFCFLQA
ncbi:hypothetical protein DACRYDRAFT_17068 [Dacryopinax primogenitus]|uniref:Uncharacterized protein n=1 Tax=Dacryopinax primogenitus (strain DJM 731) TaxID=1858805 RepID=M5G291_DACPD|nr:uncharacterized protein DACRYDRAFT_17068 [Dacryopinax primogenitus]EJT99991.1 hypothetical protein DACRYDRAFT_17068 [Dacryopinax primogenitus]